MDETLTKGLAGVILTAFAAYLGKRGFEWVKLYLERRKPAADIHLTGAQAEFQLASASKLKSEAAGDLIDKALLMVDRAERKVERLEAELETKETAIRLLEQQLGEERARRTLQSKPGNGKGS